VVLPPTAVLRRGNDLSQHQHFGKLQVLHTFSYDQQNRRIRSGGRQTLILGRAAHGDNRQSVRQAPDRVDLQPRPRGTADRASIQDLCKGGGLDVGFDADRVRTAQACVDPQELVFDGRDQPGSARFSRPLAAVRQAAATSPVHAPCPVAGPAAR